MSFKCPKCTKTFSTKEEMAEHVKKHEREASSNTKARQGAGNIAITGI